MVYVEPGVVVQMGSANSKTSFLGYHGAFGARTASGTVDVHYAVMPYPGTPNPSSGSQGFSSTFNELTAVSSHELAEAVTDPNVNYKTIGWYDDQLNGEIGDLTRQTSTITSASGVQYLVQDVVDQNDQVISPGTSQPSPNPSPSPTPSPSPSPSLTAPTLTGSAVSSTIAQLSWSAVSGAQGYKVIEVVGGQAVVLGAVSASTTSVQVTGLTPGSSASFEVEAYNSTSFADSNVVTVTMPSPQGSLVSVPQLTAHATSSTTVALSWGADPQAQGYRIYWSNGYQIVYLGTVGASTTSVTVSGLWPGSNSYFMVQAFNSVSHANSQWVQVTTPFSSIGGSFGFGSYAALEPSTAGTGGSVTPSSATTSGGHWWRGRW